MTKYKLVRYVWPALALLASSTAALGADAVVETAEQRAERMLAALGGRAAWAAARNTANDSLQYRLVEPTVVRAVITMDFTQPRFRIETTAPNLRVVRVIDGDRHWRLTREGRVEPVPAETLAEDRRWYAAHVYRTLHRVAARDPAVSLATTGSDRISVLEGGKRIAWYALDARGEPYAFGAHEDEVGSICGPWSFERGGLRHPTWVARPDGSWRAQVQDLAVNVPLEPVLFEEPTQASP
jgi:hypothetical protein